MRRPRVLLVFLAMIFGEVAVSSFFPEGTLLYAQTTSGAASMWDFLAEGDFDPVIEGSYGYGVFDHKLFSADLPTTGVVGLKFAFREVAPYKSWGKKLDERFLVGSYTRSPPFLLGKQAQAVWMASGGGSAQASALAMDGRSGTNRSFPITSIHSILLNRPFSIRRRCHLRIQLSLRG